MIEVSAVFKKLSGTEVLRGVSLSLERGRFLALIGPSGSGKSVLLKHLAGLIRPDRGHVLIDGVDVGATRGRDLEQLRRRFGFLFQNGALFDSLTSYDNIAFPLREKTDLEEDEIREKVSFVLEEVGLAGTEDKYPSELSGGMVKRTALARALVMDPEIIFFDEPTTGLDPIIAKSMLDLFDACHHRLNLTGVIVSHNVPDIFRIVNRVAMLHDGKAICAEVRDGAIQSDDPVLRQFTEGTQEGPVTYK